jgi:hypothetical protein
MILGEQHTHRRWPVIFLKRVTHALEELHDQIVGRCHLSPNSSASRPGGGGDKEPFLHGLVFIKVNVQCLVVGVDIVCFSTRTRARKR